MAFIKKHWFEISAFLILLLSIYFRFANYTGRWGLAFDQTHDALIARYALEAHKLPLLGPFSSAGPFQTGGQWYWIIMFGNIFPFGVISPWIFITLAYVAFVAIMIEVGRKLIDRKFGLLVGFLSAISLGQISQSTNLTNQSPLSIISALALLCAVKFLKTKKPIFLFWFGFTISTGAAIHLQGVLLFVIVPLALLFAKYKNPKGLAYLLLGLFIPLLPILISDINHQFFNFRNMVQYYLHDQYKISLDVLGRNWHTYGLGFLPNAWAHIIGGRVEFGYAFLVGLLGGFIYFVAKRPKEKSWLLIFSSLIVMFFIMRYTRTPLFDSYLVYSHPLILLVSGFLLYQLKKLSFIVFALFFLMLAAFSIKADFIEISGHANTTAQNAIFLEKQITKLMPSSKFAVYDYKRQIPIISMPLALYLDVDSKTNDKGVKIGIATDGAKFADPLIFKTSNYNVYDISKDGSKDWSLVNPSQIYKETENWH